MRVLSPSPSNSEISPLHKKAVGKCGNEEKLSKTVIYSNIYQSIGANKVTHKVINFYKNTTFFMILLHFST